MEFHLSETVELIPRAVADPDLELRGGAGFCFACPACFSFFCDSFLPKIRGGAGPPSPSPRSATVEN